MVLLLIVIFSFACQSAFATLEEMALPSELQQCLNRYNRRTDLTNSIGARIYWKCVQKAASQRAGQSGSNMTMEETMFIESLLPPPAIFRGYSRVFDPRSEPRVRKEYRRMTDQERNNYHRAINILKRIPLGNSNRYDVIASLHTGQVIPLAHDGANFPGWHRIYILVYENALRQIIPTVTLPYWAADIDETLEDQSRSIIWSAKFLGDGRGVVDFGPFANWITPSGPLIRNINVDGQLWTTEGIANILNQTRHRDILNPNGEEDNSLEDQHDLNHRWMGGGNGQIGELETAAQDPVFFNLHTYVDYIWEQFRQRQISLGIDPANDYPRDYGEELQAPNAPIQFGTIRNQDAYSNRLASIVYYEPRPTCSIRKPFCGTPYLRCNTRVHPPRCETKLGPQMSNNENNQLNETFQDNTDDDEEFGSCNSGAVQNRFSCDGTNDIREWVYVPVEVICRRPPEKRRYDSYPVFQGQLYKQGDIYSPETYGLESYLSTDRVKTYRRCHKEKRQNTGRVFVESNGLNYRGRYSEFAIMDSRLAIANSISYVAVKTPETGSVDVILSAHDGCGRMCKPFCRSENGQNVEFRPCNGGVKITSSTPKHYGRNYGENVLNLWNLPLQGSSCPSLVANQVRVKFFCDFKSDWPWTGDTGNTEQRSADLWSHHREPVPPFSPSMTHFYPGRLRHLFSRWLNHKRNIY